MDIIVYLRSLEFAHAELLGLWLLIPLLTTWYIAKRNKRQATFSVSTGKPFFQAKTFWQRLRHLPFVLRMLVLFFIIIALARPQSSISRKQVDVEGIDIVMALDISGSMTAMDFRPNRLEACKNVMETFITNRPNDRIGLVVYSGEAYTKCPLTSDHQTLLRLLGSVKFGIIDDGTAIGDGLGTAVNRMRESKAKSKVIVLLSDGVNNAGHIDPYSAAEIAQEFGIRVYTIGCGTIGEAPISTPYGIVYAKVEIDEALLKTIAQKTGGTYFRAQNKAKLTAIYEEIDQMEKTRITEYHYKNKPDEFFPFLVIALALFFLEIISQYTFLRIKP
jgi:Ca-activated chloride channel family protein